MSRAGYGWAAPVVGSKGAWVQVGSLQPVVRAAGLQVPKGLMHHRCSVGMVAVAAMEVANRCPATVCKHKLHAGARQSTAQRLPKNTPGA